METSKVRIPKKPGKKSNRKEPVAAAAGELEGIWENDAMVESIILEEEKKREAGLPEWVNRLF